MRLPVAAAGRLKCLRYHPTPVGRHAPAGLEGLVSSNGPSMLQSCGTFSERQFPSSKSTFCASAGSEWVKRQSASNDCVLRAGSAAAAVQTIAAVTAETVKMNAASRIAYLQTAEDLHLQRWVNSWPIVG